MKRTSLAALTASGLFLFAMGVGMPAAADKFDLKAPNGISFSEISGYETWQFIAPSYRTDNREVRVILGNTIMANAYKEGIPGNGRPFPDGSIIVKIGYAERQMAAFPAAFEPDALRRVEFIKKDAKRFPDTNGWGYARFVYDPKTDTFTPYGKDASFTQECHQCHSLVKSSDFIFTRYPKR